MRDFVFTDVTRGFNMSISEGLVSESEQFAKKVPTNDLRELNAWSEWRRPDFAGMRHQSPSWQVGITSKASYRASLIRRLQTSSDILDMPRIVQGQCASSITTSKVSNERCFRLAPLKTILHHIRYRQVESWRRANCRVIQTHTLLLLFARLSGRTSVVSASVADCVQLPAQAVFGSTDGPHGRSLIEKLVAVWCTFRYVLSIMMVSPSSPGCTNFRKTQMMASNL